MRLVTSNESGRLRARATEVRKDAGSAWAFLWCRIDSEPSAE